MWYRGERVILDLNDQIFFFLASPLVIGMQKDKATDPHTTTTPGESSKGLYEDRSSDNVVGEGGKDMST